MSREQKVAQALLKVNAVGFSFNNPIRFKSGILSPIYVNNRNLPYYPAEWEIVIDELTDLLAEEDIKYDIIGSVELGGVSHASVIGFCLGKPSVIVRKQAKDHGMKERIVGGPVKDFPMFLFEDLVTMGSSSLEAIQVLREAGAIVNDCVSIVSYGFPEASIAFEKAYVKLYSLVPFFSIVEEALKMEKITEIQYENLYSWHIDPHGWTKEKESTVFK
jgi:orotate phosphoribosyltransferase